MLPPFPKEILPSIQPPTNPAGNRRSGFWLHHSWQSPIRISVHRRMVIMSRHHQDGTLLCPLVLNEPSLLSRSLATAYVTQRASSRAARRHQRGIMTVPAHRGQLFQKQCPSAASHRSIEKGQAASRPALPISAP